MADAADGCHDSGNAAAQPRGSTPRQRPVVGKRLGKGHADAGTNRRRHANQKRAPIVVRGEGRRKNRGKRRYRTIHQASEARLHITQHKGPPRGGRLLCGGVTGEVLAGEIDRLLLVAPFQITQFIEQLPN